MPLPDQETIDRILRGEPGANGCSCDFCTRKKKHEDNWCSYCANVQMKPPKWWENLDVCDDCEEKLKEAKEHYEHGQGTEADGPKDPDCPCRTTEKVAICARAGCGFCQAEIERRPNGEKTGLGDESYQRDQSSFKDQT